MYANILELLVLWCLLQWIKKKNDGIGETKGNYICGRFRIVFEIFSYFMESLAKESLLVLFRIFLSNFVILSFIKHFIYIFWVPGNPVAYDKVKYVEYCGFNEKNKYYTRKLVNIFNIFI